MPARVAGWGVALAACLSAACGGPTPAPGSAGPAGPARHLLLVTIDTLRADRVGAYGYARARTPVLDGLAAAGLRLDRAYAAAPVTLPSHASLLTGRYPPTHGARHNGIALAAGQPTLATRLKAAGFATGAFVAAFPLDHRFGLAAGFDSYGDRLPRRADGRPADERPGEQVVDEALAWRHGTGDARTFLWVHLFEPHAPYGDPRSGRAAADRYDDDVAEADRQVGRLLAGLGPDLSQTLIVAAADHGEAFGEHGEVGHSLFVYDTTLRVPLVLRGPGVGRAVDTHAVSLVDVLPTVLGLLGVPPPSPGDIDGRAFAGPGASAPDPDRALYAETEAPRLDFGWSALRSIRRGGLKFIEAPTPELYDLAADPGESANLASRRAPDAARLAASLPTAGGAVPGPADLDPDARRRLQALGYLSGAGPAGGGPAVDPKDRVALAARIAEVTSGELAGPALEDALRAILREDPRNPQAQVRLGYALVARDRCADAVPLFRAAIAAGMPTADAYLGLAGCLAGDGKVEEAAAALAAADAVEPGNPVVAANRGTLLSDAGHPEAALDFLRRAVQADPDLHQARFGLAIALARLGRREEAAREAVVLLQRLPATAPQRAEVQRLVDALR
ncbi:MAG: sulfatase-like hydrolase/transferase [Vicinamibacterales bacterium]